MPHAKAVLMLPMAQVRPRRCRWSSLILSSCLLAVLFGRPPGISAQELAPAVPVSAPPTGQEAFQTALSTGASTYSIPITLPPGTNGMTPRLALQYNSDRGNGWIGVGWELVGLGSIERSTKKGIPEYDSTDTYTLTLNGSSQELVADSSGGYRTQIETFLRIQKDTTGWTITDTGGLQYRFGATTDSQVVALRTGGGTRAWLLDRIMDTHGNYVEVTYNQDLTNGDAYPSRITYTKNGPSLATYRTVEFFTEPRASQDALVSYRTASKVVMDQRLERIEVRMNGALVRKYTLSYTPSLGSGHSLLSSVQSVGADDATTDDATTMPPTSFQYEPDTVAMPFEYGGVLITLSGAAYVAMTDLSGDGKVDVVKTASGSSTETSYQPSLGTSLGPNVFFGNFPTARQPTYGDINGDGIIDVAWVDFDVRVPAGYKSGEIVYALNLLTPGGPMGQIQGSGRTVGVVSAGILPLQDVVSYQLADMNGDGRADLVAEILTESSNHQIFYHSLQYFPNQIGGAGGFGAAVNLGIYKQYAWNSSDPTQWAIADVNGDGLPDVVLSYCRCTNSTGSSLRYLPNEGGAVGAAISLGSEETAARYYFVDLNHDAIADFSWRVGGSWYYRSGLSGGGFGSPIFLGSLSGSNIILDGFADITGDSVPEMLWLEGLTQLRFAQSSTPSGPMNRLTRITTPTGGTISISYTRNVALAQLPFPKWVVSQVTQDNGLGQIETTNYQYWTDFTGSENASYVGWPHNELRGFKVVQVTGPPDHNNNRHSTFTTFHLDNAKKGRIDTVEVFDRVRGLTSKTIYSYDEGSPVPGAYQVNLIAQTTETYDGAGTPKIHRTDYADFDAYGQPRTMTVSGTDIASRVTTTDFVYNTGTYIVNRPGYVVTRVNGAKISETWFAYDQEGVPWDQLNLSLPPNRGNLTQERRWLSSGGSDPIVQYAYDPVFGNRIGTIDARGSTCSSTSYTTKIEFDSLYRTFPVTEINALCQQVTKSYWGLPGNPLNATSVSGAAVVPGLLSTVTDSNNVRTDHYYDGLGRPKATVLPPDTAAAPTTTWIYADFSGIAPAITPSSVTRQERESVGATLDSVMHLDGFGRTVQTKSEAEGGGWITRDTTYNSRGLVESVSIPYTRPTSAHSDRDTAKPKTTTLYDGVRRPVQVTNPDGTLRTTSYDRWVVAGTNEKGVTITRTYDALDRLIKVQEPTPDGDTTFITYDDVLPGGQQVQSTANAAGVISIVTDTLGRPIAKSDPARGSCGDLRYHTLLGGYPWYQVPCWGFQYDANGNLLRQRDGKDQEVTFVYDALNRVTEKSLRINAEDGLPPSAPRALYASAASNSHIYLTWNAPANFQSGDRYQVERSPDGSTYVQVGETVVPELTDVSVSAGTTYVYRVRALDSSGNASVYCYPNIATAITFTDDVSVRADHFAELRAGVNAVRRFVQLADFNWTPSDSSGNPILEPAAQNPVRAQHVLDLRGKLREAYDRLYLYITETYFIPYFDTFGAPAPISPGSVINKVDIQSLRNYVRSGAPRNDSPEDPPPGLP